MSKANLRRLSRQMNPGVLLLAAVLQLLLVGGLGTAIATRALGEWDSESAEAERCVQAGLLSVMSSCASSPTPARGNTTNNTRDVLISLLHSCLGASASGSDTQGIRLLVQPGAYVEVLATHLAFYSTLTGLPIQYITSPTADFNRVRLASLTQSRNRSASHEIWMASPASLGDGVKLGAIKDITPLIKLDNHLKWEGLLPPIRTTGLMYNSKIVAMPFSANSLLLMMRKDVFAKHGFQVPNTWRDLVTLATQINGTDGMHAFCGYFDCLQQGQGLMRHLLASYIQTQGLYQGWLFDPDTLQLLIDSPVLLETFNIIKALHEMSPRSPNATCGFNGAFAQGSCIITLSNAGMFKWISHTSRSASQPVQGNLGLALLPGTTHVLDRATNRLVPCDMTRCPYATRHNKLNGTSVLVNRSPGYEAVGLAINQNVPEDTAYYAFTAASYLASAEASDQLVFHPSTEVFPTRTSQLRASRWVAAGYNEADSAEFTRVQNQAYDHGNAHTLPRMPSVAFIVSAGNQAVNTLTSQIGVDTEQLSLSTIRSTYASLNNATDYVKNRTAFQLDVWASINRIPPPSPPPPPAQRAPVRPVEQPTDEPSSTSTLPVLVIVLTTTIPAVLAVAAVLWCLRGRSVRHGAVSCPGPGPLTTVLISDIENSTLLWESLDPGVMDQAIKMHNVCLRTLAAKHLGYESAWEGDSFIIAFKSPQAALTFSLEVQTQLLTLPWPPALLASPHADEVFVLRRGKALKVKPSGPALGPPVVKINEDSNTTRVFDQWSDDPTAPSTVNRPASFELNTLLHQRYDSPAMADGPPGQPRSPPVSREQSAGILGSMMDTQDLIDNSYAIDTRTHDISGESTGRPVRSQGPLQLGHMLKEHWSVVEPRTHGAVTVYRGLRVRLGMHAGDITASDINYNAAMGRYHFSGSVRNAANAIASAAHGGQILMASEVAGARDAAGRFPPLPPGCHVYNMGVHQITALDNKELELVMALPSTLKCRLAVRQDPLRGTNCIVAGVLSALVPTSHLQPVLTYVQVCGLGTLMAWDSKRTTAAVETVLKLATLGVANAHGVVAEDGLSLAIQLGAALAAGTSSPEVVPGRYVVAFPDAPNAFQFAIGLRNQLLTHAWDPELLAQPVCEVVGNTSALRTGSLRAEGSILAAGAANPPPWLIEVLTPGQPATLTADSSTVHPPRSSSDSIQLRTQPSIGRQGGVASGASCSAGSAAPAGSSYTSQASRTGSSVHDRAKLSPTVSLGGAASHKGICSLDASLLRGLRTKIVMVDASRAQAHVCKSGSGRLVYSGKATKLALQLLKKVRQGQIVWPEGLHNPGSAPFQHPHQSVFDTRMSLA